MLTGGKGGDLSHLLDVINDHLYQRDWLFENADNINKVIRRAIHRPDHYHHAVSTLINLIPVMFSNFSFKLWWERLLDSLVIAQDLGDQDLIARLTIAITKYHTLTGSSTTADVEAASKYAHETLQGQDDNFQLEAYATLIETYIMRHNPNFRPEMFEEALTISARSENTELKALLHQMVAIAHAHRYDMDKALFHARRSAELAAQSRDKTVEFRSMLVAASVLRVRRDFETAAKYLEMADALFPLTPETPRNQMLLAYEKASLNYELDKFEEARAGYLAALKSTRKMNRLHEVALCRTGLVSANINLGRYDEADQYIDQAEKSWRRINNSYMVSHTLYSRALVVFKRGNNTDKALELMNIALANAQHQPQTKALEWLQSLIQEKIDLLRAADTPTGQSSD